MWQENLNFSCMIRDTVLIKFQLSLFNVVRSHLTYVVFAIEKSLLQFTEFLLVKIAVHGVCCYWKRVDITFKLFFEKKETPQWQLSLCHSFRVNYKLLKKNGPQAIPDFIQPYYYIVRVSNIFLTFTSFCYLLNCIPCNQYVFQYESCQLSVLVELSGDHLSVFLQGCPGALCSVM